MAIIYIITNKLNGKQYVGFTIHTLKHRWNRHVKEATNKKEKNMPILRAIRKYGKENFSKNVLFEHVDDGFVLTSMEPYYIWKYKTHVSTGGYNATMGGRGSIGLKHTDKTKQLLRTKATGRKHSTETKKQLSKIHKGKKFTETHKENIRQAATGRKHSTETKSKLSKINEKFLYRITDPHGKIHTTSNLNQFCKDNDINQSNMAHVVSGRYTHHKGYKAHKILSSGKCIVIPTPAGVTREYIRQFNDYRYVIFADEYSDKPNIIEKFITEKPDRRIYARKTTCGLIDNTTAREFVNQNHIQNISKCSKAYGIKYDNELIMVMVFAKHHRTPLQNEMVLQRMCSLCGTQVIGGASKLLKHAINDNTDWDKIISWSDNRISDGNVYNAIGFIKEASLPADYSYYDPKTKTRYNKQKFMKSKIDCGDNQTERERMDELGYKRVYDLGKTRWIYNISQSNKKQTCRSKN